jgi:DNA-directed RNA polymerase subunit M/transcription elongation factor TFIIS
MNFELKICRICLKSDLKNFKTFSSDAVEVSQIFSISSIKIEEENFLICQKCRKRLKDAIKLRSDCIKAAKYFQTLPGNSSNEILENVEILPKKKKKFQCSTCPKFFSCVYYLKQHELAVHTQVPPEDFFECDQCETKTKTKALMRAHQLTHHCNLE